MNQVLLDTHAFLWFLFDDPRLSGRAAEIIEDPAIDKALSIATLWEIVIKTQVGKLVLGCAIDAFFAHYVAGRQVRILAIEIPDLLAYGRLPLHHRDPFDRLLLAQAATHGLPILTSDKSFSRYDVEVVW